MMGVYNLDLSGRCTKNVHFKLHLHYTMFRMGKAKEEGWVLLVGDPCSRELVALKRVGAVRGSSKVSLVLDPGEQQGARDFCLYVVSDGYQGLDQQYSLPLMVEGGQEVYYSSEDEMEK